MHKSPAHKRMAFWKRYKHTSNADQERFVLAYATAVDSLTETPEQRAVDPLSRVLSFATTIRRQLAWMSLHGTKKELVDAEVGWNVSHSASGTVELTSKASLFLKSKVSVYYITDQAFAGLSKSRPLARILIFSDTTKDIEFEPLEEETKQEFKGMHVLVCVPRIANGSLVFDCRDFGVFGAREERDEERRSRASLSEHLKNKLGFALRETLVSIGGRWSTSTFSVQHKIVDGDVPFQALWEASASLTWPMFDVGFKMSTKEREDVVFEAEYYGGADSILLLLDAVRQDGIFIEVDDASSKHVHFGSTADVQAVLKLERLLTEL